MNRWEITFADGERIEIEAATAIQASFAARRDDPRRRTVLHIRPLAWGPPDPAASP